MNAAPITQKLTSTVELFWTAEALAAFQADWDAQFWDSENENPPAWLLWLWKIGTSDAGFPSTTGFHHKTETALNNDVFVQLYNAAATGCNLTLARVYYKLYTKWSERGNDTACDYLANAWDCISTAQVLLAKKYGVLIDWHVEDLSEI